MGLLDDVLGGGSGQGGGLGQAGGLGSLIELARRNPQIISAALALLNPRDPSVGGGGGLGDVIAGFQRAGLGHKASQWVSTGPNPPASPDEVTSALGADVVGQFADKAGVPKGEGASVLASLLPGLVDHLTPSGEVPPPDDLQAGLGALLSGLRAR